MHILTLLLRLPPLGGKGARRVQLQMLFKQTNTRSSDTCNTGGTVCSLGSHPLSHFSQCSIVTLPNGISYFKRLTLSRSLSIMVSTQCTSKAAAKADTPTTTAARRGPDKALPAAPRKQAKGSQARKVTATAASKKATVKEHATPKHRGRPRKNTRDDDNNDDMVALAEDNGSDDMDVDARGKDKDKDIVDPDMFCLSSLPPSSPIASTCTSALSDDEDEKPPRPLSLGTLRPELARLVKLDEVDDNDDNDEEEFSIKLTAWAKKNGKGKYKAYVEDVDEDEEEAAQSEDNAGTVFDDDWEKEQANDTDTNKSDNDNDNEEPAPKSKTKGKAKANDKPKSTDKGKGKASEAKPLKKKGPLTFEQQAKVAKGGVKGLVADTGKSANSLLKIMQVAIRGTRHTSLYNMTNHWAKVNSMFAGDPERTEKVRDFYKKMMADSDPGASVSDRRGKVANARIKEIKATWAKYSKVNVKSAGKTSAVLQDNLDYFAGEAFRALTMDQVEVVGLCINKSLDPSQGSATGEKHQHGWHCQMSRLHALMFEAAMQVELPKPFVKVAQAEDERPANPHDQLHSVATGMFYAKYKAAGYTGSQMTYKLIVKSFIKNKICIYNWPMTISERPLEYARIWDTARLPCWLPSVIAVDKTVLLWVRREGGVVNIRQCIPANSPAAVNPIIPDTLLLNEDEDYVPTSEPEEMPLLPPSKKSATRVALGSNKHGAPHLSCGEFHPSQLRVQAKAVLPPPVNLQTCPSQAPSVCAPSATCSVCSEPGPSARPPPVFLPPVFCPREMQALRYSQDGLVAESSHQAVEWQARLSNLRHNQFKYAWDQMSHSNLEEEQDACDSSVHSQCIVMVYSVDMESTPTSQICNDKSFPLGTSSSEHYPQSNMGEGPVVEPSLFTIITFLQWTYQKFDQLCPAQAASFQIKILVISVTTIGSIFVQEDGNFINGMLENPRN
ncbi:hypothetical protein CONPUDRAFT_73870 [Coniophora puteana RWD-64-598 SS2]|uniref:Uncharacterized protein n=1 Tax=Coniophora puteana (strain RWD-64-598) TaxID=741705 RepID=A0A5M3MQ58_CONPW|nr:uncharacterized protein CONPUDRAFT_73870 [Coniophora puteana RWD-64-598 SS2]EIW80854.1 hypothetical protein CONPUDRAFT_73870 [Coniophora puteana RWD-64-598 SS2]